MYNIPQCTHNRIELETVVNLASENNIQGIKDSSGDFKSFSRGLESPVPENFSWIQGEDLLDGPSLLLGASGLVTGLGNVWIEPYIEMYKESQLGNELIVRENQKRVNKLYDIIRVSKGKAIPAIKLAVSLLGRSEKWTKLPGYELDDDEISAVEAVLAGLGLL
jgi:4-hydroxy-tetrahydrodipicolinate synthase